MELKICDALLAQLYSIHPQADKGIHWGKLSGSYEAEKSFPSIQTGNRHVARGQF